MHAPLFVTIDKPWCHSADVRAGANKQENDEKERLEVQLNLNSADCGRRLQKAKTEKGHVPWRYLNPIVNY